MAISALFFPDLKWLASDAVKDREESALFPGSRTSELSFCGVPRRKEEFSSQEISNLKSILWPERNRWAHIKHELLRGCIYQEEGVETSSGVRGRGAELNSLNMIPRTTAIVWQALE